MSQGENSTDLGTLRSQMQEAVQAFEREVFRRKRPVVPEQPYKKTAVPEEVALCPGVP